MAAVLKPAKFWTHLMVRALCHRNNFPLLFTFAASSEFIVQRKMEGWVLFLCISFGETKVINPKILSTNYDFNYLSSGLHCLGLNFVGIHVNWASNKVATLGSCREFSSNQRSSSITYPNTSKLSSVVLARLTVVKARQFPLLLGFVCQLIISKFIVTMNVDLMWIIICWTKIRCSNSRLKLRCQTQCWIRNPHRIGNDANFKVKPTT